MPISFLPSFSPPPSLLRSTPKDSKHDYTDVGFNFASLHRFKQNEYNLIYFPLPLVSLCVLLVVVIVSLLPLSL